MTIRQTDSEEYLGSMKQSISIGILLWIDGLTALIVGLFVLSMKGGLSTLFNLPETLLYGQAIITLIYASYTTTLARKKIYSRGLVRILGIANLIYVACVIALLLFTFNSTTDLGKVYFLSEIIGIAMLGIVELKQLKYLK